MLFLSLELGLVISILLGENLGNDPFLGLSLFALVKLLLYLMLPVNWKSTKLAKNGLKRWNPYLCKLIYLAILIYASMQYPYYAKNEWGGEDHCTDQKYTDNAAELLKIFFIEVS